MRAKGLAKVDLIPGKADIGGHVRNGRHESRDPSICDAGVACVGVGIPLGIGLPVEDGLVLMRVIGTANPHKGHIAPVCLLQQRELFDIQQLQLLQCFQVVH